MRRREVIAGMLAAVGGSSLGCRESRPAVSSASDNGQPTLDELRHDAQALGVRTLRHRTQSHPFVRRRFSESRGSRGQSHPPAAPAQVWASRIVPPGRFGQSAQRLVRHCVHQGRACRAVGRKENRDQGQHLRCGPADDERLQSAGGIYSRHRRHRCNAASRCGRRDHGQVGVRELLHELRQPHRRHRLCAQPARSHTNHRRIFQRQRGSGGVQCRRHGGGVR